MITLILVAGFVLASCLAAAGLIASTRDSEDSARAMAGLQAGRDVGA